MIINNKEYQYLKYKGKDTNYYVSEDGDIINIITKQYLTPCVHTSGRLTVHISINGEEGTESVHRLTYMAFYGDIPEGMTVNHIDENYLNNHYTNLELMTRGENSKSYIENNGPIEKIYSDVIIEMVCKELSDGMYYRDVAFKYDIPIDYVYRIVNGKKRRFVSEKYLPFPNTARIRREVREVPHDLIKSLILQNYTTDEIFKAMELKNDSTNRKMIARERVNCGIKDPKYFSDKFINSIDDCILDGLSNDQIIDKLKLEYSNRLAFLLTRRRKKCNIPDFNENGVPLEIQDLIIIDIQNKMLNDDIFKKYGFERTYYTINMMGRLRQKAKKEA